MIARLLLLIVMSATLAPALDAKDAATSVKIHLTPSTGAKFLVTQVETYDVRTDDCQTITSERRSDYDLEVVSSGADGWLASLKRKQVNWNPSGAKAVPNIAFILAGEAAMGEAEVGIARRIRFSPIGKVTGLPDGRKFHAVVLTAFPRGLNRFFLSPDLVRVFGGEQAAANLVKQLNHRAQQIAPGKNPTF